MSEGLGTYQDAKWDVRCLGLTVGVTVLACRQTHMKTFLIFLSPGIIMVFVVYFAIRDRQLGGGGNSSSMDSSRCLPLPDVLRTSQSPAEKHGNLIELFLLVQLPRISDA